MKSDTIEEIFRLFDMNAKTEKQVMALIKESGFRNTKLCQTAIPYLRSEDNILKVMSSTFFDEEVCKVGLKTLITKDWSDNKILAFLKKVENDRDSRVKRLSIPYFKLKGKKEYEIINLLRKTEYDFYFLKPCIDALGINKKNDDQLIALMEIADYHADFCFACIKGLKKEENILALMERNTTPDYVISEGASSINWDNKNDEEIYNVMTRAHFKSEVCEVGITHFKSEDLIIRVLEKTNYDWDVCAVSFPLLKFEEKDESALFDLIKTTKCRYEICEPALKLLKLPEKTDDELMDILKELSMNTFVCQKIAPYLKSEKCLSYIVQKTDYNEDVCAVVLKMLYKGDDDLVFTFLEKTHYSDIICEVGIPLLKSEESIFRAMENAHYVRSACGAAVIAMKNLKKVVK